MAYATANPPRAISRGGIAGPTLWYYTDGDTNATVDTADYFTDGDDLGMKVGDPLIHFEAGGANMTLFYVSAVTAGGAATVIVSTVTLA